MQRLGGMVGVWMLAIGALEGAGFDGQWYVTFRNDPKAFVREAVDGLSDPDTAVREKTAQILGQAEYGSVGLDLQNSPKGFPFPDYPDLQGAILNELASGRESVDMRRNLILTLGFGWGDSEEVHAALVKEYEREDARDLREMILQIFSARNFREEDVKPLFDAALADPGSHLRGAALAYGGYTGDKAYLVAILNEIRTGGPSAGSAVGGLKFYKDQLPPLLPELERIAASSTWYSPQLTQIVNQVREGGK